jgi:DNA-binding MarR family transcriptional regulator
MKRSEQTNYSSEPLDQLQATPEEIVFQLDWQPLHKALSQWTGFMLFHVTELAGKMYAQALASIHLAPPQVGILQLLESEGSMVQARLSDYLSIDKATMVGLLNDLESQGLVERKPNPNDKRSYLIHLHEAGHLRLKEAVKINDFVNEQFFADLTATEQKTLHKLLERLATSQRFQQGL